MYSINTSIKYIGFGISICKRSILHNVEAINPFQSSKTDAEVVQQSFLLESYSAEMGGLFGWVFSGYRPT